MSGERSVDQQDERLLRTVLGVNNNILAIVIGVVCGLGIFLATILLVVKGGPRVGQHLSLLSQFFPGYRVTYLGSVVGMLYGFGVGYLGGWLIAWLYNRFVELRNH